MKGFKAKLAAGMLGLAVILAGLALYVAQPVFLLQLDNWIYDALLTSRPQVSPSPVPVIIDIDEEALETYGQWPWPRYRLAELIRVCSQRGAAAVALDILLSEPDRSSPESMREYLQRDTGLSIGFTGLPSLYEDYDQLLAEEIGKQPVVLGMYARFGGKERGANSPVLPRPVGNVEQVGPDELPVRSRSYRAVDATVPLEVLHRAAPVGLINMSPDSDGFVRRVPLLTFVEGKPYVNLGLRALMTAMGKNSIITRSGPDGLSSIRLGEFTIPVSPQGDFTVPFTGPRGEYPYISAARVLDGSLPPDAFAGNILFVGTSAPGLLDIRSMPYDRLYPGVEVHAAALDAILTGRSMVVPYWTPGLQVLCILFAGTAAGLAFTLARPRVYIPTGIFLLSGALFGSWYFFRMGLFVSPLYAVLTISVQGVLLLMLRFWQEERQKIMIRQAFSRYVAPEVVKRIAERQGGDIFSGDERELSIMFTDIRSFTSISEKLDPRQVVSLLNNYFTPMTALVRNHGGTLDKFIGDALMAFWNAPLDVEDHPVKAVETSLLMQEELELLNRRLQEEFDCVIRMGAGIHTGKVYVGNMGSEELVNYTLIGDNVNLTSRLEGLCSEFGVKTVISSSTMQYCANFARDRYFFLLMDTLKVKGREQPVSVYTVMRPAEAESREKEFTSFHAARDIYVAGDFAGAERAFSALCSKYPDEKMYTVYQKRALALAGAPPKSWDGIWALTNK